MLEVFELTSRDEIAHDYLKKLLPTTTQKRIYRDYEWPEYPIAYKYLDRALTLFAITPGMHTLHAILYDFYIDSLSINRIAEKFNFHPNHLKKLKKKALEEFYSFIPHEYR